MDLRCRKRHSTFIFINREGVEIVDTYKFLGVHINNKLDWSNNSEGLYRKGETRLFFLLWM